MNLRAIGDVAHQPMLLRPYPSPPSAFGDDTQQQSLTNFLVVGVLLAGFWWIANSVFLVEAYNRRGELVEWRTFFDREAAFDEYEDLKAQGYSTEISRLRKRFA